MIDRRIALLTEYQNAAYAAHYASVVRRIREAEAANSPGETALTDAVARALFKLMAYKDEYEVARLLTQPDFQQQIRDLWQSAESVSYNLHPPILRSLGLKKKLKLGSWFRGPLWLLARMKGLRGTPVDPFGYASIRREERALIAWYRQLVEEVLERVTPENLALAIEVVCLPDQIRGYEHIKMESIRNVKRLAQEKLALVRQAPQVPA